ncbi:putative AC transposase [Pseudolycoriella hygida]|uniref:AC transposase n=1 Tax=Pseudolycoriella hygida TaxID=35572 RepID=A0A9Q0MKA9_9DIPT|nr:putative AC transposase [Pseudolycoriella hygida]
MIASLNADAEVISESTVKRDIMEMFASKLEKIKAFLKKAPGKYSFSLDARTSKNALPFMAIRVHWVDEDWVYHSILLDFCYIIGKHDGENFCNMFVKCLDRFEIPMSKILSITMDNAFSNDTFMDFLSEYSMSVDVQISSANNRVRCLPHVLNLCVQDIMSSLKVPLNGEEDDHLDLMEQKPGKSKIRCFDCNTYGHKAYECTKGNSKKNSSAKPETSTSGKTTNAKKPTAWSVVYSGGLSDKENWFVDSGASAHFTMRKDWMENHQSPKINELIVANNSKLSVESSGTVNVNVEHNKNSKNISISNVQYVPDISANLLSVSQLVLKGFTVTFDKSGCRIIDSDGEECATAKMVNNVFQLNLAESKCFAADKNHFWPNHTKLLY